MRWLLRPSEVRSRYSCTTYLASGKCKTSSIPLSPPTAADFLATGPTAPNTPPSADNTLLNRSSRTVRLLNFAHCGINCANGFGEVSGRRDAYSLVS